MDIYASRQHLLVVIAIVLLLCQAGCTETSVARVRVRSQSAQATAILEKALADLRWMVQREERGTRVFRKDGLEHSYIGVSQKGHDIELALVAVGTGTFSDRVIASYRDLVLRLRREFGEFVEYDAQTSRRQPLAVD